MWSKLDLLKASARDAARRAWASARGRPWLTAGVAAASLPMLLVLYALALVPFTPGIGDVRSAKTDQPAVVISADGKQIAAFRRLNREWVTLADISPHVVSALIATEDHRFYQHHGIDLKRTAAAVLHTAAGRQQGGSTLTQQLARNLYPEDIGRAPTITRKLKEAITALKIEAVYSKPEILETYLNTVPFLYNAHGIEMAARTYFDKSARNLDELESATLIGMLKGTSYYNPVLNPDRAKQRRNVVLSQMVRHDKLTPARFDQLKKKPLKLDFERQDLELGIAPHFTQVVRRWLVDWADRNGYNIYDDGLRVHTTLDARLQAMANAAVTRQGSRLQKVADGEGGARAGFMANKALVQAAVRESVGYQEARQGGLTDEQALKKLQADAEFMKALRDDKTRLQAGFLALDPQTGAVRAWVGSRDYADDQFDHVQQARRQPGSTFKPFVYGAAFEHGARATDTYLDEPVEIRWGRNTVWRPTDVGEPSHAPLSLRQGLMYSKNTITAQVMQRVGPSEVAGLARAMGVRQSKLDEVPSLALGTSPVTLMEMVAAYGTIAGGGQYHEPVFITRVEDRNGRVLAEFAPPAPEAALSVESAQTLLDSLRGVVDQGTGTGIRSGFGIQADVAGKTGTTQKNTDGWFILMHPQLVAGAWVGFNDNRVTMKSNYWGQGAHNALYLVGDFFQQGLRGGAIDPLAQFDAPRQGEGGLLQTRDGQPLETDAPQLLPAPGVFPPPADAYPYPVPMPQGPSWPTPVPSPPGGNAPPQTWDRSPAADPAMRSVQQDSGGPDGQAARSSMKPPIVANTAYTPA